MKYSIYVFKYYIFLQVIYLYLTAQQRSEVKDKSVITVTSGDKVGREVGFGMLITGDQALFVTF